MDGVDFYDVSFGRARQPLVLERFTPAVEAGETIALVGASGAGKTTVLKLVNRLLVPDSGTVRVQGRDTREWDAIRLRRAIGYVVRTALEHPAHRISMADMREMNLAADARRERPDEVARRVLDRQR